MSRDSFLDTLIFIVSHSKLKRRPYYVKYYSKDASPCVKKVRPKRHHRTYRNFGDSKMHIQMLSFINPCQMTITLDDVSCPLHLPIREKLLDHGRIRREEGVHMMVRLLGADPGKALEEAHRSRGAHS